jgi:hypothetical protein
MLNRCGAATRAVLAANDIEMIPLLSFQAA